MNHRIIPILLLFVLLSSCRTTWQDKTAAVLKPLILQQANEWFDATPETVTAQFCERSAGSRHDFYSEGDYWWPDPANPTVLTFSATAKPIPTILWRTAMLWFASAG